MISVCFPRPHGYRYFDYLTQELPEIVGKMFHVSQKREDTFIAGLSMGGYGALKAAVTCPEKYSYAASLSGVVDVGTIFESDAFYSLGEKLVTFDNKNPRGGAEDILLQAKNQIKAGVSLPKLFCACGQQDFLYESNLRFYRELKDATDIEFLEEPGGHVWDFWDRNILRAVNKMPVKQRLREYSQTFIV